MQILLQPERLVQRATLLLGFKNSLQEVGHAQDGNQLLSHLKSKIGMIVSQRAAKGYYSRVVSILNFCIQ